MNEEKNVFRPSVSEEIDSSAMVLLRNCSAGWDRSSRPVVNNVDANVQQGSFVIVIGPVGSGKSSLLHTVLGEIPHTVGTVIVQDVEVAFCAQTPWLINATLKDNIIGHSEFDSQWYNTVVKSCALDRDFTQLPGREDTMIGSKGIMLSGGQKGRLALARAVYARKPLVILDDVFAGLDAETEQDVYTALFGAGGLLRQGTTTVLATNSNYIIVLGPGGTIVEQGMYSELISQGSYLASLDPKENRSDETDRQGDNKTAALDDSVLRNANLNAENRPASDLTIYKLYVDKTGRVSFFVFFVLCSSFAFGLLFSRKSTCGLPFVLFILMARLTSEEIWIKFWVEANARKANDRLAYYLSLYVLWSTLAIFLFLGACLSMLTNRPQATDDSYGPENRQRTSRTSAQDSFKPKEQLWLMYSSRAPLGFLSGTDSGEIANRFSQDLELVDMELPRSLIGTMMAFVLCVGELVVILYSSKYIAATVPVLIGLLYLVQMYYLKTSRQLRILEIQARAPLLTNFMETLQGLSSVRAFGWMRAYATRNDCLLVTAQQSIYLLYCAQLWLSLTLDMIVAFLAITLVSVAVTTRTSSGASIGLALVNIVAFGASLKGLVYNWTALEISMGAIARIQNFTSNTPCEDQPDATEPPPPNWPDRGLIHFHDVSAAYSCESSLVLKNVSLEVQPGQKLAVCGRTGSGKSSLVGSLLRLLDLRSGTIEIDGLNISAITRQEVRSRLITLPQESFFYYGTVRENLDIQGQRSDEEMFEILARLGLHELIIQKGGLDVPMTDDLLSHGQKQLFCVARAALRTSRIIILDEVTSSVDQDTETIILDVLRERFPEHTVVCIAHRLKTILDYDQAIVLDEGSIVECGNPVTLASQSSKFADLLRATGDYSLTL
ncbi:ABC multidrug transporter [Penicillium fimorum]|uniref:ABC multidrug transporter n=1 Tax=Penicillium fimorum TaxID=1882269 RepID=A0A9W9Y3J2_9EURO|nr:ABC multidrug transporter [Penicillium fimorum]